MQRFSESAKVVITSPSAVDVGGTTAATAWTRMGGEFHRALGFVEIGAWAITDTLDHFRLEAAEDNSGTNPEEVTSDGAGGDYDTAAALNADGDQGVIEIRALDLPEGKPYVRLVIGADDDGIGVDEAIGVLVLYDAIDQYEHRQGAASATRVYVEPS